MRTNTHSQTTRTKRLSQGKRGVKMANTINMLSESIGADLDALAQESSSFEQFVAKVKSDPDYTKLDVNNAQVASFLQTIYDGVVDLKEARGFTMRELRLRAVEILRSIGVPLSDENIQDMLGGLVAKIQKYNAGGIIAEFVETPISSEVVFMIKELAEGYGVNIPTQIEEGAQTQWNTVSMMAYKKIRT